MASSSAFAEMTPAQRLMAQHSAAESHQPTVEEVVDEEDLAHPPPSDAVAQAASAAHQNGDIPMSAKAAGKQRVQEPSVGDGTNKQTGRSNAKAPIDTSSEVAFPSLAAPAPGARPPQANTWGVRPASLRANGGPAATGVAPGAPTHSAVNGPATRLGDGGRVNIPGRKSDEMTIAASQLKSKDDLKRPLPDILKDINKRSKAQVTYKFGPDKTIIFEAQGPSVESARETLRQVASAVGQKQTVKVAVPYGVVSYIIGPKGARITEIQNRSGARIHTPKGGADVAEDELVDLEIQGDPVAAGLARREIEKIVKERTANVNTRLRNVPPELFPFIAGAHNRSINQLESGRDVRVNVPHYHTWQNQPPPQVPNVTSNAPFLPRDSHHIQIAGDREAAMLVQAEIERQVAELQRQLVTREVEIEKARHRFILGDKASSVHDFLEETGCTIIMPPPGSDSETITIVGRPDQVENAVNKAMDLVLSWQMVNLDISRQHANAPRGAQAHARDLARYLQHRQALAAIEKQHDSIIVLPGPDGSPEIQVSARDGKNAMRARSDITNVLGALPPSRFRNVDIHPYYQSTFHKHHARALRENHGVHVVTPDESGPLLLVYEGSAPSSGFEVPRNKPSPSDVAQFEQALAEAEKHLFGLLGEPTEVVQHSVDTPAKHRERIQRFVKQQEQRSVDEPFPVEFLGFKKPAGGVQAPASVPVEFRGPSSAAEQYRQSLLEFIEESIREEAERGYTLTFDFPQKFKNLLIGRKGENVNKIRDDFDVDISAKEEGKVEIKGPKAKAEAAKSFILNFARKQEDETTHVIKIKPDFHGNLIGTNGAQIRRLQDRHNVRINFPRAAASPDTQSLADGASDAGVPTRGRRPPQAPDEVVIRGPKRGADEARSELLDLYQYSQETSHTGVVSVSQKQLPSLIGAKGRELDNLRVQTGASINVPGSREAVDPSGRVEIQVKGTKDQVDKAKKELQRRAREFDDSITKILNIDKKYHSALIGNQGENVRRLVLDAGGLEEERNRIIKFPAVGSDDDAIRLQGQQDVVEKLAAAIEAFAQRREEQVTQTVEVAPERHRKLIGRGGETKKGLESDFSVSINIPSLTVQGPARSQVKITGLPQDVQTAVEAIQSMMKSEEGETVLVPRRLHHTIADSGNFFNKLRRELKVNVDHAGHQRPERPAAASVRSKGAAMPLITDTGADGLPDVESQHGWEIVEPLSEDGEEDDATIPWVLKGQEAENIAKARERLLAELAAAQEACVGYLVLPDPGMNRFIVGPGGSTINSIRKETGCKIDVPKSGGAAEAIEIRGKRASVERAKELAIEAVVNGASQGGGRRR